jgi:hypothetical protein
MFSNVLSAPMPFRPLRALTGRVRRVRRMPLAEIAGRGRQEGAKLVDRVTASRRAVDPSRILREHAPALARPGAAMEMLRCAAPRRFFAGVEHPKRVASLLPEHCEAVVKSADATLCSRFDLLGYRALWFGDPIDWHRDPVWSRQSPPLHWTQLNPLDAGAIGDSKIVWELNRHQWITRLGQAHALTGDEKYAQGALSAIDSWIEANPYGFGLNWSSSLEASYRIMSWTWTLMLLRQSAALSAERAARILAVLWLHARHVERYLSYYFSPNTHLTGEALGLFYAGTLLREFRQARRWRNVGARVLLDEIRSQVCADGVHFERSTCYHRYTLETYLQFLLLATRNHLNVSPDVSDRVNQGLDFLQSMRRPDGSLPEIGDADGGSLMPLVERDQCDPRGVLAVGAAMLGRGDLAWAAGALMPDVVWLTGETGAARFGALEKSPLAARPSQIFPAGGYAVMRTSYRRDAHQMIVDVGPLGCSFSCGHGHADLLSVQCSAFGEPVLVDAGTYCYTPEREWRNFFRGTAAHSTLTIDGRSQVEATGPFSWRGRPGVQLRAWRTDSRCDFVDASHSAYTGLTHRRRVLFVKPDYWVIVDDVQPSGAKRFRDPFSAAHPGKRIPEPLVERGVKWAPMAVEVVRDRWARAGTPRGNTFWIGSFGPNGIAPVIKCGEVAPIRGWISTAYGQRTPAPLVVFAARAPLPWRSITLLLPRSGAAVSAPAVRPLFDDRNLPIGLELDDLRESILVDDTDIFRSADR